MPKDLKIGLFIGLVLTISALLWLATRPSLSPMARMSHAPNSAHNGESVSRDEGIPPSHRIQDQDGLATHGQDARDTLPDSAQYEQAEKIKTQKFHIVLKGQTLTQISQKYYGSVDNWQKILDSNRKAIKDPNKLIPGTKLIIPD